MLLSFCSIAFRGSRIDDIIPRIAELGYDGIEIWGNHVEEFHRRNGEIRTLSDLLMDSQLSVPLISPYFSFTEGEAKQELSFRLARKFSFYSKVLGNAAVRVFVGPLTSGQANEEHWRLIVESLQRICDESQTSIFCLETHQGQLMDTTASTLEIIRRVERPNLRVLLDIHNLFAVGEDPPETVERLYQYTHHIHIKNFRGDKACYLEEGDMDYRPFLRGLRSKGYDRYISVEWFGDNPWKAAAHELSVLRSWMNS